jgi:hypothetical protein
VWVITTRRNNNLSGAASGLETIPRTWFRLRSKDSLKKMLQMIAYPVHFQSNLSNVQA